MFGFKFVRIFCWMIEIAFLLVAQLSDASDCEFACPCGGREHHIGLRH
jgi:hypothetical protein